ncbi:MAG: phosphate-binding protein [Cyanobacteria bacterium QS_8_64_29]|nr:MAG: phosphate-binding protein [Cyanobacteria bacterium QS_8_64_29]
MVWNARTKRAISLTSTTLLAATLAACGPQAQQTSSEQTGSDTGGESQPSQEGGGGEISGSVAVDGSSTVFPIAEAVAEEFQKEYQGVNVTVGVSGTGGGFKKFCRGDTDISDASRPIQAEEIEVCENNDIEYVEVPVGRDALAVLANPENDWASCLTTEELKTIFEPEAQGEITNWSDIRSEFPNQELSLYIPGTDSGTFDYFTETIVGEAGASRGDVTASEDDNVLVQGISDDVNALGYFGLAYYEENQDKLKPIAVDNGDGCVEPSTQTAQSGEYTPLTRPLFMYINRESLENKPQVEEFVSFLLASENQELVSEVGYIPISDELYQKAQTRVEERKTGTMFEDNSAVGKNLSDLM